MPAGVYLHIPFCKSRCSYCDFATDIYRATSVVDRYIEALCKEIDAFDHTDRNPGGSEGAGFRPAGTLATGRASAKAGESRVIVDTIYFGGGTPSLLIPKQIKQIVIAVGEKFSVDSDSEITMEMNPATVTPESLSAYKKLGINRASFGVQTFNDRALKLLARGHDANDARQTYKMLRDAGFENISFDLIAGLPGQTLEDWEKNLDEAIGMSPEHLSLYLLEIHEGKPLAEQVRSGRQPKPDDDLAARMYETMCEMLAAAGYKQYEISNFAKPGFESRHNSKYWRLEPVYGFGVSAHSFDGYQRYSNERDTSKYVERIENFLTAEVTRERVDTASEFAFLGLRLEEGINLDEYSKRFEIDLETAYRSDLNRLLDHGLIELDDDRLKLTQKGKLFSNEVFAVFI